ncbi:chromosome partition protein Smc [Mycoplasma sp. CAG:877]|mgnify:FL=1|nr:chromosome partition protein Smc [Mycoplasma sp. CAG:877]
MYLKEIVTTGFKSFADKLDIKLDDKITCIVGPNGSGKSNVVDAVRWVLGEQSVKSLRGEGSMSDVIFSGSKSRNPLNVASVELVFDNTDHYINVPYTEISIKRKVYRTGENEYYLNGEKCRLKDVTNLLLDTGMGKESFNIISQGEVEKILSNSPSDRRVIFEEAAGILKYKRRKEEALRKLDRTHNNLDRVNDIITELEIQVGPLKEQSEKATEYLENKKGLDNYEVALLAYDIENYNQQLEQAKQKKEKIDKEIVTLSNESSSADISALEDNTKLEKLEQEKTSLNNNLLKVTEEVEKINGEKNLLKERSKTNKEEEVLKETIRTTLEKKGQIEKSISLITEEINSINQDKKSKEEKYAELEKQISTAKNKRNYLMSNYSKMDQDLISLDHKISSLRMELEQSSDLPNSVRSVLKDTFLQGIHNTIGNIITIEDTYLKALNVAISSNKNFVITSDEESAKKAINYLKDNHLGRATFFPLTVIKPRFVDSETLNQIRNNSDFIAVLSDLLTYNKKYQNIIENQFGTTIISKDLDSANRLSKLIRNRYKIITLDGDVINVGGSMTGGSLNKTKSVITTKQELKYQEEKEHTLKNEIVSLKNELSEINNVISKLEEENYLKEKEKISISELLNSKNIDLSRVKQEYESVKKEWENLEAISNNSVSEKEQELIKLFHEKSSLKEQLQLKLKNITKEIDELKVKIEETQATYKLKNSTLRNLEKSSRELEISINRLDVKIDNMLNILSEDYELTFERAKNDYSLDIEPEEARVKVNTYRNNIKRIGMVNLGAIEEYERVNTRYSFLTNQREDLYKAESTLLEIMNEMDEVMEEEFKNTFMAIQIEFQKVFKELFNGGQASLKLTDPSNMLTTGVEIVASPPGKKLTTISLLSGGEKTLTAISLLFAILNVRSVPFCLFDEVEAALDEANVAGFGTYLNHYRDKTQFLIITHKKKTMEYANTLYGITMQESGVSKLVSVKLEDHMEVV